MQLSLRRKPLSSILHSLRPTLGFTLIELMVVVTIIAILSAVGFGMFTGAQKRSRDAKRRGDVLSLQKAEEQYYFDSGTSNYGDPTQVLTPYLVGGALPVDPTTNQSYFMSVDLRGVSTQPKYCFCAQLEITGTGNAFDPTPGVSSCNYTSGGSKTVKDYFCVQNLQ